MIGLTDRIHVMAKWLAATALLTMMVLTFVDVNLRYWLGQPILGSNEMTEFLLGTVVFSGLVIVTGERSHIVVTLFERLLMSWVPGPYRWLGIATNLLGIVAVTYLITNYTVFMHAQGNETEIRHWQWWWLGTLLSALAALAILMAVRAIRSPLKGFVMDGAGDDGSDGPRPGEAGPRDPI